jgi:parallel beta-helix repeat protein
MRAYFKGITRDGAGNIIPSATVSVYEAGGTTAASIYTTLAGATAVNSVTSGTDGSFEFYISRFDYNRDTQFKLVISKTGYASITWDYISLDNIILTTYTISADTAVSTNLGYIPEGVVYSVASGKTLTLSGDFTAGDYQIFDGDGTVAFNGNAPIVYPEWFGVVGDGTTDDTTTMQQAMNSAVGRSLYLSPKTYLCDDVEVPVGVKKIYGNGVLKGTTSVTTGVLCLNTSLTHCEIDGISIDMSNDGGTAIEMRGASYTTIKNCYLYGFGAPDTKSRFAVIGRAGASYNRIVNNKIIMNDGEESGTYTANAVSFYATTLDYGGYFTTETEPSVRCSGNIIQGNIVMYGEVSVDLLGADNTNISGNVFYKQKTRSIYLANTASYNEITGNNILGASSSAIVISYCSHHNKVTGNFIKSIQGYNYVGGEAAINAVVGIHDNQISDNYISSYTNYGVYLAVKAVDNVVTGNVVEQHYLCAIALEGEWQDSPPELAIYSRPNYGEPPVGTDWALGDSTGNVIADNIVGDGFNEADSWVTDTAYTVSIVVLNSGTYYRCTEAHTSGTFATDLAAGKWISIGTAKTTGSIYLSQLASVSTDNYYVKDNVIKGNIVTKYLENNWPFCFFEETSGYLTNNVFTNNHAKDVAFTRIYSTRGKDHFYEHRGNDAWNDKVTSNQPSPTNCADTAPTLTIDQVLTGIVYGTPTTGRNYSLPTGTTSDASNYFMQNEAFDWSIINLAPDTHAITLVANTDHTIVGSVTISAASSARYRTKKTAANTFITYRIS